MPVAWRGPFVQGCASLPHSEGVGAVSYTHLDVYKRQVPTGDFSDLGYDGGYNVNVPIGWHSRNHFLGVRLDLGYSQFTSSPFTGTGVGGAPVVLNNRDPRVLSAALDLTAQVPLNLSLIHI